MLHMCFYIAFVLVELTLLPKNQGKLFNAMQCNECNFELITDLLTLQFERLFFLLLLGLHQRLMNVVVRVKDVKEIVSFN